ncbi:AraC family transcriptional regulator [Jeongeupia wiesaeckerbachi]|uniref:AraC family transcriptional regulator n=1 Tax=Jeongeupia wiesaeckerbachi TaxID=3051218 RepID=UPI003D80570F
MLKREWLSGQDTTRYRYFRYEVDEIPVNLHYHPEFELTFTQNGAGSRYIGSEIARCTDVDLVLIAPNQPHSWDSPKSGVKKIVHVIFFDPQWIEALSNNGLPEAGFLYGWLRGIRASIVFGPELAMELSVEFEQLHEKPELERAMSILGILGKVERRSRLSDGAERVKQSHLHADARLQAALDFINKNFTRKITLSDASMASNLSDSSLKRLLRLSLDTCFSEMLTKYRIEHACNLLLYSAKPASVIGAESGFNSPSNFYRAFMAETGMTPLIYRNEMKKLI